jgi:peptidoglycan/LPS O-acetylase OafA/YrhL
MAASRINNYFPALDGLRAIAAFTVFWTHIERFKQSRGEASISGIPFNSFIGGLAVTLFFVLSGFLITDLLLKEEKLTGKIQISRFLRNRFLRIGPLYFLTLIAGYLVSIFILRDTSSNALSNGFLLNLFMLSNIAFAFNLIPEILIQIWSIGTEVQFYLSWPFLVRRKSGKKLVRLFIAIIICWALLRAGLYGAGENKSILSIVLFRTRFDCMAIGALVALMMGLHENERNSLMKRFGLFLLIKPAGLILGILFLLMVAISWKFDLGLYPLYSVLFACLIYRWSHLPPRILSNALLRWLGKISYGIYLIHHFAVYIVFATLAGFFGNSRSTEIYYFICASLLTVALGAISYYGFERRFLQMKLKFPKPEFIEKQAAGSEFS